MTLSDYLQRPGAEIILLAEIDTGGAVPIYLADAPYITEPGDAPANQPYAPVIGDDGMPRLSQRLTGPWGGSLVGSWGDLRLTAQQIHRDGAPFDLVAHDLRHRSIALKVTGRREEVAYSQAQTLFTGRIGEVRGRSDGTLTLELEDLQSAFAEIMLPQERYDAAAMGSGFPASNDDKVKPMLLGWCRNVTPVLIDSTTYTYQVNAIPGDTTTIGSVYDGGVSVARTDNGDGTFSLTAQPAGLVTCDAETTRTTSQVIIEYLLSTYAGITSTDIWEFPWWGSIANEGIYLDSQVSLAEVLDRLARGICGWGGFDGAGTYRQQPLDAPAGIGPVIGATDWLDDVEWWNVAQRYNRIPALDFRNWTRQEPAADVFTIDPDLSNYLRSDGHESIALDQADIDANGLREAPRIDTYLQTNFLSVLDDSAVAQRALRLYGVDRKGVRVRVPAHRWPWGTGIGDSFTLADTAVDSDYLITSYELSTAGGVPVITVEGIG